jgi:adenosylcobinamide kinase/adenosylcobinamide-phosphate guanylyltransferase
MIILITGGARSGKSRQAQDMALSLSDKPVYVATAKKWGGDFDERIRRHQSDRSAAWTTIEAEEAVSAAPIENRVAVIDCITLWLTNFFIRYQNDIDKSLDAFKAEIDRLDAMNGSFIIVTNEIGMGVHAETEIGRKFTDLQGWANQYTASKAAKVILMVSGLPLVLKQPQP